MTKKKVVGNKTQLDYQDDWDWYKQELDVAARYKHDHKNEPKKYPCLVISEFCSGDNMAYYHHFFYQKKDKCPECGHERTIWNHEEDVI